MNYFQLKNIIEVMAPTGAADKKARAFITKVDVHDVVGDKEDKKDENSPKKDKSRKADKQEKVVEGIRSFWTADMHNKQTLQGMKKTLGDFRTKIGKANKDKMLKASGLSEHYTDVQLIKLDEMRALISEIDMYFEKVYEDSLYNIKNKQDDYLSANNSPVSYEGSANFYPDDCLSTLRSVRDKLLSYLPIQDFATDRIEPLEDVPEEYVDEEPSNMYFESLQEDFKQGSIRLDSGETVKLSKNQVSDLNALLKSAGSKANSMAKRAKKSKDELNALLDFAEKAKD